MKRSNEQGGNSRKRGEKEEDTGMDMEEEAGGLVFEDPFGDDFEEEEVVAEGSDEEQDGMDEEDQMDGEEDAAPR
jgi:hypothetical protein